MFVAFDPVLVVVVVVVHGHDGHGLAKISLFSNALNMNTLIKIIFIVIIII